MSIELYSNHQVRITNDGYNRDVLISRQELLDALKILNSPELRELTNLEEKSGLQIVIVNNNGKKGYVINNGKTDSAKKTLGQVTSIEELNAWVNGYVAHNNEH